MTVRLGDTAPDFTAPTTQGEISFHEWRGGRASVTQLDGARWVTFEGTISVVDDPESVASAVVAYAQRYRQPKERTDRVVLRIEVDRVMCNRALK